MSISFLRQLALVALQHGISSSSKHFDSQLLRSHQTIASTIIRGIKTRVSGPHPVDSDSESNSTGTADLDAPFRELGDDGSQTISKSKLQRLKKKKKKEQEALKLSEEELRKKSLLVHDLLNKLTTKSSPGDNSNSKVRSEDGWGPDELAPKENGDDIESEIEKEHLRRLLASRSTTSKSSTSLPTFSRRIEGILDSSKKSKPVLADLENPAGPNSIAKLAHGLDRVLFNPGVHWLQDPRSHVYNFSPYLKTIPDVKDFAFEKVGTFVPSSRDEALRKMAISQGKRFGGSTSSLTGLLSQIYFLISANQPPDITTLSAPFQPFNPTFTPAQRMPASVTFNHRDGVYLIDSDRSDDEFMDMHILLFQGTMLENFLTMPRSSFEPLLRSSGKEATETKAAKNTAYRYSKSDNFVMRSQLDCQDHRLPGTGVFDIKTRATISIRMDSLNYKESSGYLIRTNQGIYESFEREYYDMIRAAFLKYNFQARIGNMDGIFVAYHNTAQIFGFQYIPVTEMDARLFGGSDRGPRVFEKCVALLEVVAKEIADCFPEQSISCMVETSPRKGKVMHVWLQRAGAGPDEDVVQFDVAVQSFVDRRLVSGSEAIGAVDKDWLLLWSVAHSSLPQKEIKINFEAAKRHKIFVHPIPTGVDPADVENLAASEDYGFTYTAPEDMHAGEEASEREGRLLSSSMFTEAGGYIKSLRRLSRAGRADNEIMKLAEKARGVKVWKQTFDDGDADL